MDLEIAYDGGCAVVRLSGRLDGEAAQQLGQTVDQLLREGQRSVLLDMEEVTYLSSPGLQLLQRAYQDFFSLRGELRIKSSAQPVLDVLARADLRSRLVVEPDDTATLTRLRTSSVIRALEFTRDAWRSPLAPAFQGSYEVTSREPGGALTCRAYGHPEKLLRAGVARSDCRVVDFPENSFGLGIGAIGRVYGEAAPRMGELVGAAGTVAYLPTEGAQVPDFDLGPGNAPPVALLASGLVCEGSFSQLARFSTTGDADAVPLSEVARMGLDAAQCDTIGLVVLAETAGLVGAWLRRSPGIAVPPDPADVPALRDWFGTTPAPIHEGATALVVGVASRDPDPLLSPHLRPLKGADMRGHFLGLWGHFHAVIFTYRPVPQRTVALRPQLINLFKQERVRGIMHLFTDDRRGMGAGESEFRRGLCWAAPVTHVTAAA
jgi:anti-anti-sigma factor